MLQLEEEAKSLEKLLLIEAISSPSFELLLVYYSKNVLFDSWYEIGGEPLQQSPDDSAFVR